MGTEDTQLKNDYIQKEAYKYGFILSKGQISIVRKIVFREHNRQSISAHTRYGKTQMVALAIAIMIDKGIKVRVAFIGPKIEQAGLLRQYMADLIVIKPSLLKKAQLTVEGIQRIQKEASRKRMTFTTGAEYRVFSAEGDANRIMGFGVDKKDCVGIVVKDEAILIDKKANSKITRMMGANPDNCMLIELYNPWDRDNIAFEHTMDPAFDVTHIGWQQGVVEGRTTKDFVDEQRRELTPLEFEVLWESKFPSQSDDSIFNLDRITEAEKREFTFEQQLCEIEIALDKRDLNDEKRKELELELDKFERIVSCDPADMGLDEMVMKWGTKKNNKYQLIGCYYEPKSDPMEIVGKIMIRAQQFIKRVVKGRINLDRIGIGTGPLSRINELIKEKGLKNIEVFGCHFGQTAIRDDVYRNKKAENYFGLAAIFEEGFISLHALTTKEYEAPLRKLRTQLVSMKWKLTSSALKIVVDPDKSPDHCFVAGTKILTTKGNKNIEDIDDTDIIITPYGNRKVLNKSSRIVNEVLCCKTNGGDYLIATGNHNIYTNETFKYLKDFSISDKLESGIIKWRLKKLLNIREENIGFREKADTTTTMSTMEQEEKVERKKHYIDKYGKIHIIKKFLKGLLYTILMEIPLIIILKTFRLEIKQNIEANTKNNHLKITQVFTLKDYKKLKKKQKSGTNQKKDMNGTNNTTLNISQEQNITKNDVLTAIKNMKQQEKKNQNIAHETVICQIIGSLNMAKKGIVCFVKKSLSLINIQNQNIVHIDVLHCHGGIRVYNLEVDKDHVYYADNFLVSNSDDLVYFIWREKKPKFIYGNMNAR